MANVKKLIAVRGVRWPVSAFSPQAKCHASLLVIRKNILPISKLRCEVQNHKQFHES